MHNTHPILCSIYSGGSTINCHLPNT